MKEVPPPNLLKGVIKCFHLVQPQVPEAVEVTNAHRDATPHLPEHVPYLLVGGGTASFAAYRDLATHL